MTLQTIHTSQPTQHPLPIHICFQSRFHSESQWLHTRFQSLMLGFTIDSHGAHMHIQHRSPFKNITPRLPIHHAWNINPIHAGRDPDSLAQNIRNRSLYPPLHRSLQFRHTLHTSPQNSLSNSSYIPPPSSSSSTLHESNRASLLGLLHLNPPGLSSQPDGGDSAVTDSIAELIHLWQLKLFNSRFTPPDQVEA